MTDQITDWFSQHIVHGALQLGSRMSILAVSGGVDSMVMAELYLRSGCPVVLAHVNYQLRGEESNGDEKFVREWARERGLPFEMLRVDGRQEFKAQGEGIQEGARRIRYEWLEEIRKKHDAQWIATAHHLNDSVETALFHLIRGCGLRGLHGIPFKSGSMLTFAGVYKGRTSTVGRQSWGILPDRQLKRNTCLHQESDSTHSHSTNSAYKP